MFHVEHFRAFEFANSIRYHGGMTFNIKPICAFKDNYIWLLINTRNQTAWVVDPGDAAPVTTALKAANLTLEGILITHHHHDHSGGVLTLLNKWKKARVIASHKSQLRFVTEPVTENITIDCGTQTFKVLEIPGHTLDHIAFYNNDVLFCGDTLFSAGCGRVFEGTPAQMYHSLSKLLQLSDAINIYCGHEYTQANLQFAQLVEPNNLVIQQTLAEAHALRVKGHPTLPSNLAKERQINPFLRCEQPDVICAAENYSKQSLTNPVEIFAILREWKNTR